MNKKVVLGILTVIAVLLLVHFKPNNDATAPSGSTSLNGTSQELSTSSRRAQKQATFDGDPCTYDCSGHEAGYNWAESRGISDEDDCDAAGESSNSPSFAEGCKAYVRGDDPDEDTTDDDADN